MEIPIAMPEGCCYAERFGQSSSFVALVESVWTATRMMS